MKHNNRFNTTKRSLLAAAQVIDLANFNSMQGFSIHGASDFDLLTSISLAPDFNNDTIADFVVGSQNAPSNGRGRGYVAYGKNPASISDIDLATNDSTQKLSILNPQDGSRFGQYTDSIDFNNDGISDAVISQTNRIYVIYGMNGNYPSDIDLTSFTSGPTGFIINLAGSFVGSFSGIAKNTGDFDNDGIDDLVIGDSNAAPNGRSQAGIVYILYGLNGGHTSDINLDSNTSSNSQQRVIWGSSGDNMGRGVSTAGDFNNDNIDDVAIASSRSDPLGRNDAGTVYIIYGQNGKSSTTLDVLALQSTEGVEVLGSTASENIGLGRARSTVVSLNHLGDFNNDGISDLGIGTRSNYVYVVYGKQGNYNTAIDLASPPANSVLQINGISGDSLGSSLGFIGDVNNDGFNDIGVGDSIGGSANMGKVFVIYGPSDVYGSSLNLASLTDAQGIIYKGP
ncbi:MAG: hypothetical protein DGJ47_001195, partial [Rickettsiaceae bacterium]